ncbi:TerB family tellurite resistance protein [Streptomyces sp. HNM0574]|uniref:TerB family tellurite resistance protein n=1 Tax=Streptomyces sp. HNM0574 TaxID=2714954 RepID=UPI0032166E49
MAGTRTSWRTTGDGEFFCPACGGDRNYRRREGQRRYVLLGLPLMSRGRTGPVLECAACRGHFATDAQHHPTSRRLSAMLRDGVHAVALAVLAIDGAASAATRQAAVDAVRGAGFPGCSEEQLLALLAAFGGCDGFDGAGGGEPAAAVGIELHEALAPLAPHLARQGREGLLLAGARIALADGPYQEAERDVLGAAGVALNLPAADVGRLLTEAARTPS